MFPGPTFRSQQIMGRQGIYQPTAALELLAPAKLNLYLEVLGRRPDGFHELETLMVPVGVYDQLRWLPAANPEEGVSLSIRTAWQRHVASSAALSAGPENLVLRAAQLLAEKANLQPHGKFELYKRIPLQAGMGGGSSDAAAALLLANVAWGLHYGREELLPLAAQLGSDVPFFLSEGAAVCRGRGELVEPVRGLPKLHFVVVKPAAGLSTAEVFANVMQAGGRDGSASAGMSQLQKLIDLLRNGALGSAARHIRNRLELVAVRVAPWLEELQRAFSESGCLAHFLTGSGSAYVGLVRSVKHARGIAGQFAGRNLGSVFITSSC